MLTQPLQQASGQRVMAYRTINVQITECAARNSKIHPPGHDPQKHRFARPVDAEDADLGVRIEGEVDLLKNRFQRGELGLGHWRPRSLRGQYIRAHDCLDFEVFERRQFFAAGDN